MKKRMISLLVTLALLMSCFPLGLIVYAVDECELWVDAIEIAPGDTGVVNISIKNNPGVIGMGFSVSWDEGLTLIDADNGAAFSALNFSKPSKYTNGCVFTWYNDTIDEDDVQDGVILSLTFSVEDGTECDQTLGIRLDFDNAYDLNLESVTPVVKNGGVSVIDYTPGDVNGDTKINTLDLILICRYIADGCKTDPDGYNVVIIERAANVNNDNRINTLDLILICRYIADGCTTDPDGYNVTLKPSSPICSHQMEAIEAKSATCLEEGNNAYWHCVKCDKYFSDEHGYSQITLADTVLPIADHIWDDGVMTIDATETEEGEKVFTCTVCGVTKTTVIPKIDPEQIPDGCYRIHYYLYDGKAYLEDIGVSNPNPAYYDPATGLTLRNLSNPNYTFNGWYDSEGGEDSTRVRIIPKGSEGEYEVYARWTPKTYNVTLDYDFNQEVNATYTFGETYRLPISPAKDGYRFISWTDQEDASVHTTIPVGTSGDKYYYANWLSNRNQAWSQKTLRDPIIAEVNDKVLFAYEIGEIKNVPLDVIKDFGYTMQSGVKMEVDETYSATTSSTQMNSLASTVSKAITNSYAWTLSNDWSKGITVDQEWAESNNMTEEKIEKMCKSESGNWYSSTTSFSSTDTEELGSTETHNLATTNDNTKTYNTTDETDSWKNSAELSSTLKGKLNLGPVANGGFELTGKVAGEQSGTTMSKTGTEEDSGSGSETGDIQMSGTNTTTHGGFNTESGSSSSKTTSRENEVKSAISTMISKTDHYGEQYIEAGGSSENQGFSENNSATEEVVSSVTYSTQTSESTTVKYTINNTNSGCHRYILVGTAHVYGVVGYDIANQCYFSYTFSVMDDERHMMEDYCPNPGDLYHDHEFSGITFEIPYDICGYVDDLICATEGIEINSSGIVTGYTGDSQIVIVPKYISYRNADGTRTAVRVVGVRDDAFQGANKTNIGAIQLPDTVTTIPAHAFEGCTSLIYVGAPGVTEIGNAAYAGCDSLHVCFVDEKITTLGDNVFDGMSKVYVTAANADIAAAAVNSGVSEIYLTISEGCTDLNDTELVIPDSVSKFVFNGGGKTFTNLRIESHAAETQINNSKFVSDGQTPLDISSPSVRLGQVHVDAAGIALILSAQETSVELYGESFISSECGRAVLCRSAELSRASDAANTTELTIVDGNILRCGTLTTNNLLKDVENRNLAADRIEEKSAEDFANYQRGVITLTFDANSGTLASAEASRTYVYGTAVGECPVPTKDYYTFLGWYTEASGGTKVEASSTLQSTSDMTLYAHWALNPTSGWVKASDAPGDAQITNTKYSYTHRYYTTNSASYLAGWTLYNTQRTGWGATQGPVYGDPSNGVRNVWSEQYVSGGPYYNYYHCVKSNSTVSPAYTQAEWDAGKVHLIKLTYELEWKGVSSDSSRKDFYGYYDDCSSVDIWYKCGTYVTYDYGTRWYYQDPVYTYTYYRDVVEEGTTQPSGSEYSNVVRWVQYRPRTVNS